MIALATVNQEGEQAEKQPKAFIRGLRDCNPGDPEGTETEIMRQGSRESRLRKAKSTRLHCLEGIMIGTDRVKLRI